MPKKTIYVREEDKELFEAAERQTNSLSALLSEALRDYLGRSESRRERDRERRKESAYKILWKAYRNTLLKDRKEHEALLEQHAQLKRADDFVNSWEHASLVIDDYARYLSEDENYPATVVHSFREPLARYIKSVYGDVFPPRQ